MTDPCILVSVVRDFCMYEKCIQGNPFVSDCTKHPIDNRPENNAISLCYNGFLDAFDYTRPAWFVFCHEDFQMKEPLLPHLSTLCPQKIYGPIGAVTRRRFGWYYQWQLVGRIQESSKNGSGTRTVGQTSSRPEDSVADTLDCQCLIVHSSLVRDCALRFDENLRFDLYTEDFCIQAREKFNIPTLIVPLHCQHWSKGTIAERYDVQLDYLRRKWPDVAYTGTAAQLIGGGGSPLWKAEVALKRAVQRIVRKLNSLPHAR